MKTLVIDRKRWARGGNGGASALLNNEGNMCCLGFLGKACGAPANRLLERSLPSDTKTESHEFGYWSNLANIPWPKGIEFKPEDDIAALNDDIILTDEERESALKPLFLKLGYRLKFVG